MGGKGTRSQLHFGDISLLCPPVLVVLVCLGLGLALPSQARRDVSTLPRAQAPILFPHSRGKSLGGPRWPGAAGGSAPALTLRCPPAPGPGGVSRPLLRNLPGHRWEGGLPPQPHRLVLSKRLDVMKVGQEGGKEIPGPSSWLYFKQSRSPAAVVVG